jgi:hypothetical protein
MKKLLFAMLILNSVSSFADWKTWEELKTEKSCSEIRPIIKACEVELMEKLSMDLFETTPTSIRKMVFQDSEYSSKESWVVGVIKKDSMKAKLRIRFQPFNYQGHPFEFSNLRIEVGSLKHFENNPYISKKETYLNMPKFPQATCKSEVTAKTIDVLGNPTTLNTRSFVKMWNTDDLKGEITNGKKVIPDLTYDAQGFFECVKSKL